MNVIEKSKAWAHETRNALGLGHLDSVNMFSILRLNEISCIIQPLSSDISGLFIRKGSAEVILINSAKTLGHQHFTAAHELCHLLYHKKYSGQVCNAGQNFNQQPPIEKEADIFASHFLAPDDAIEYRLNKRIKSSRDINLSDCIFLEQYFQVSHHVMLIRLRQIGKITEQQFEEWQSYIIKNARELGYETNLYKPTNSNEIISDYAEKAKESLNKGLISRGKYEEMIMEAGLVGVLFGEEGEDE